jgi:rsbT co-antagonist protein RsbR
MDFNRKIFGEPDQDERHHFFALSADMLCIVGFDGYFKYLNQSWVQAFGVTMEKLMSMPFVNLVHPDDQASTIAAAALLSNGGEIVSFRNRYRCIDGTYRLLEWKGTVVHEQHLIYAVGRDVTESVRLETEQRAMRERLEHLLHSSRVILYSSKTSGGIEVTFVSSNVTAQLGYEPRELLEDPGFWADRIHPDDSQRVLTEVKDLFTHERHACEYRFRHKDGTYRWVHDDCRLVKDANGHAVEVVGSWQDITERKQAELTIQQQATALSRLSTPLIPISKEVIVMPLVGLVDSARTAQVMDVLLEGIVKSGARVAILDVTGVGMLDIALAEALLRTAKAVRLLGAQFVITGMRPDVAQTVVRLGIDLGPTKTCGTLQAGILYAIEGRPSRR